MAKVYEFLANGGEEIEALAVVDILRRGGVDVTTVSITGSNIVEMSHNVTILADTTIEEADFTDADMLLLPGGMPGTTSLEKSSLVQYAIDSFMKDNKLIAAICAAPSILIHKGLLDSKEFVCFPGFECGKESLRLKAYQHNNIITGNGLGGSIEFSALIIANLLGKDKADEILTRIRYINL